MVVAKLFLGRGVLTTLHKQHGVDAAVVFGVVCHLGVLTPDHLTGGSDKAKVAHIDLCARRGERDETLHDSVAGKGELREQERKIIVPQESFPW